MINQQEHRLSFYVAQLVERVVEEPMWATAIDHGAKPMGKSSEEQRQANMIRAQRMKARGIKPSHLDWAVYQRATGIYAQFELKVGYNKPDDGQETTMRLLRERGIPTGWARTLRGFYELLVQAGFKLHGNAPNILAEIEARYEAAQDMAAIKREEASTGKVSRKRFRPATRSEPRYTWKAGA